MTLTDLTCERGVLGGLLLQPERMPEGIAAGLMPESFAAPGHGATFNALVRLGPERSESSLFSSVVDELRRAGDLALMGPYGSRLVTLLIEALPPDMIGAAIERLLMLASARMVQAALRAALDRVERDPAGAHLVLRELPIGAAA